jgi:hypothetical protein
MAHERELVQSQALPSDQRRADDRWPVPYAILFITVASAALWSLIIIAAKWLLG